MTVTTSGSASTKAEGSEDAEPELLLASTIEILKEKSFARCTSEELPSSRAHGPRAARRAEAQVAEAPEGEVGNARSPPDDPPLVSNGGDPGRALRTPASTPPASSFSSTSRGRWRPIRAPCSSSPMPPEGRSPLGGLRFGTRLTRLTRALGETDPDEALRQAASEVFDWDGGTRIGESLKHFLDDAAGVARGSVVDHLLGRPRGRDPRLLPRRWRGSHVSRTRSSG